jgi:Fe-S cluster biosynthesis and repair protein YggX
MKHIRIMHIFILTILCFFMTACSEQQTTEKKPATQGAKVENLATTPDDIKKEAADLARTTLAYTEEQKTLYQEKIQKKMAQYSQKLLELETKLVMMNEQARAELAEEMEKLKDKKAAAGEKVQELQAAGNEAYDDLKEGLDRALEEMDKAYDQAMERFQK